MEIAEKKKRQNIVEYIIYIYQAEDLIRAFDGNISDIKEYVLKHIPQSEEKKAALTNWYAELLAKMTDQGILQSGHIDSMQKLVAQLDTIKDDLIKEDDAFKAVYDAAKSHIDAMLALAEGKITNEVQICINGVYGHLLAKINGRQIPEDLQPTIDHFGNVLSYLSYKYKQNQFLTDN